MSLGVRGKLFALWLLVIVTVVGASGLMVERQLRTWLEQRLELELTHAAHAARVAVTVLPPPLGIEAVDPLADELGRATGTRITIMDVDGALLGDSELGPEAVARAESHRDRPEVESGLGSSRGVSRRHSMTLGTDMLYVAVPWVREEGRGAVRAAMSLAGIDAALRRLRLLLVAAGAVAFGLAVLVSALASHVMSRGLRRLAHSARQLGTGGRVSVPSTDELGLLAGSLNRMAEELDGTLQALAAERDRLATVLEGMSDGVIALDERQHVLLANPAAQSLLEVDDTLVDKPLLEVARTPALHDLAAAGRGHAETRDVELPGDRPRRVLVRATPLASASGTLLVLHEVTEIRRLETIRRDFVANVSHELRTPVTVIRANAEMLMDGALADAERASELTAAVLRNAERLSRLVADLLDLSRMEAGKYPLAIAPTPVAAAAGRAADAVLAAAAARHTEVAVRVPGDLLVEADAKALEQILINLLDNAVKYSSPASHVAIRARPYGEEVRIEVCDDGPGIDPVHRARLFERFYRVDPGRSRDQGGTGLGLAIVKHLAGIMGGRVGVEPALPRGSVFWLTLPASGPPEEMS